MVNVGDARNETSALDGAGEDAGTKYRWSEKNTINGMNACTNAPAGKMFSFLPKSPARLAMRIVVGCWLAFAPIIVLATR